MSAGNSVPWYRRVYRWGQTNITEIDPIRYDDRWWREHWRRTRIQGVIVNAGGIVHYYPSKYSEVHRALHLGERDLYGDIVNAAREEGLAVLARMDSNRIHEPFYVEHPEWCAVDAEGRPYRAGDLYVTCVNSPYYDEFLPGILREIIERTHPDGFGDNSYSGLGRDHICYCQYCAKKFRETTGMTLPRFKDWDDPVYRAWIEWNYARRLEIWDINNRATQAAGGKDCLWIGMISGDVVSQSMRFRDNKGTCERTKYVLLDYQSRGDRGGFHANAEAGKLLHSLMGSDTVIAESMAMYQHTDSAFRVASKSEPEARMWAVEGFAAGINPWWHHIGAYHDDRRQYRTAEPLFRWHEVNEEYLENRTPIASVGVVWSQTNVDFYGRDDADTKVTLPYQGVIQALIRARIPYMPIHIDHVERDMSKFSVLILPNVGAMSDAQVQSIRQFAQRGGALIATGESSLYDEWGDVRPDFALADLFGAHARKAHHGSFSARRGSWDDWAHHTYLRLRPELRANVYGPQIGTEPTISGERHSVLSGFEETDILPFGGRLEVVQPADSAQVLMTLVPPFPIYPPETSWMRKSHSTIPALILNEPAGCGRVAYLPADIDRCYGRHNLPDHCHLLANLVRWCAGDSISLRVEGTGFIDCHLYSQPNRLVLHLVNLTNTDAWRGALHELIPIGPIRVSIRLPEGVGGKTVKALVQEQQLSGSVDDGWITIDVERIEDHEVIVVL